MNGRPETRPLRKQTLELDGPDGRKKSKDIETYAWLIGMTDTDDETLGLWAQSYATPPQVEPVAGARLEAGPYVPERRALRLVVEKQSVTVTIKPQPRCINPVLELSHAPKTVKRVSVDEKPLDPARYTWDGKTLWLDATFSQPAKIELRFAEDKQ